MNCPIVVITGAAGYIGSNTCDEFLRAGYQPGSIIGLDLAIPSEVRRSMPDVDWIECDVSRFHDVRRIFDGHRAEVVVHLAGYRFARKARYQPRRVYERNVATTLAIAAAANSVGSTQGVVFASTCSVYGNPAGPVREGDPLDPISGYARSKLSAEFVLRDFSASGAFNLAILRFFNAVGKGPRGLHDRYPEGLFGAISRSLDTGQELPILGIEHETPDGSCIRDFVSVIDVSRAIRLATESVLAPSAVAPLVVNLGSGYPRSVVEVIRAVEAEMGVTIRTSVQPADPADPDEVWASVDLARDCLQWEPEVDFSQSVRQSFQQVSSPGPA